MLYLSLPAPDPYVILVSGFHSRTQSPNLRRSGAGSLYMGTVCISTPSPQGRLADLLSGRIQDLINGRLQV